MTRNTGIAPERACGGKPSRCMLADHLAEARNLVALQLRVAIERKPMSNPSPVPAASNTFERIKRVESREKKRLKAEPKKLFGNKSKAGAA